MQKLGLVLLFIWTLFLLVIIQLTTVRSNPYDYPVTRVIDGDTVEFEASFLPGALKQKMSLRIDGVDTPEKSPRSHCPEENMKSLKAKLFTEQEIMNAMEVKVFIKGWVSMVVVFLVM
jgi:endonuclease YncB( thermonuclease family)